MKLEDKRVEEGKKKTDFPFNFFIVDFGENKNPLRPRFQFFRTVFINPDIYIR